MSKIKNNHEALLKSGQLKPEDTPKILKEDFLIYAEAGQAWLSGHKRESDKLVKLAKKFKVVADE